MALFVLARFVSKSILIVCLCVIGLASTQVAAGQVPRGAGHAPGARASVPRVAAPHVVMPPTPHGGVRGPHFVGVPRFGITPITAHFAPRPGHGFRAPRLGVFLPLYRFPVGYGFSGVWWPTCAPAVGWWAWGYNCVPSTFYGYGYENYAALTPYQAPMYLYGGTPPEEIWLYRKNGTMQPVTDYWFVSGDVRYATFEDDPRNPGRHSFPYDDLDVQKTTFVNSRRGFRIVFRDAPWQQWLKDHPDQMPPDVPPGR